MSLILPPGYKGSQTPPPPQTSPVDHFPVYEPPAPAPAHPPKDPMAAYQKVAATDPDNERVLLFTIGGVNFYRPKNISPQLGFKLMRDTKRFGQMTATATLIEELLGPECLDALADAEGVSPEDWETISEIMANEVLGAAHGATGKG